MGRQSDKEKGLQAPSMAGLALGRGSLSPFTPRSISSLTCKNEGGVVLIVQSGESRKSIKMVLQCKPLILHRRKWCLGKGGVEARTRDLRMKCGRTGIYRILRSHDLGRAPHSVLSFS